VSDGLSRGVEATLQFRDAGPVMAAPQPRDTASLPGKPGHLDDERGHERAALAVVAGLEGTSAEGADHWSRGP
jgi:hypothetical protein